MNVTNKQAILQLGVKNNIWRAPIAACVLGGVLVLLFNLMGCIILLKCVRPDYLTTSLRCSFQDVPLPEHLHTYAFCSIELRLTEASGTAE